ncbi:MAG: hypothetical protein Kow0025_11450 [Thermodesulfovibrionales bacterium]
MNSRWLLLSVVMLAMMFSVGFMVSHSSGIQPGYFEKAEAPAYGVGGGDDSLGAEIGKEAADYYKKLLESTE